MQSVTGTRHSSPPPPTSRSSLLKVPVSVSTLAFTTFSRNCCLSLSFCRHWLPVQAAESKHFRLAGVVTRGREYGVMFSKHSRTLIPFKFKTDRKDICQGKKKASFPDSDHIRVGLPSTRSPKVLSSWKLSAEDTQSLGLRPKPPAPAPGRCDLPLQWA